MSELALTMIVRDEAEWIEPCLDSALVLGIDTWLIADTGSVDETRSTIHRSLGDVPGELIELPWEGHADTRSELLLRAHGRADYLLMLDADMTVEGELPVLTEDVYTGKITGQSGIEYALPIIVSGSRRWGYRGAAHSFLAACDNLGGWDPVDSGLTIIDRRPGAYREGKLAGDAALLEAALEADPTDSRSSFYLAQTYQNLGRLGDAIREYGRRALMAGWAEERYVAKLRRARLLEDTGEKRLALAGYLDAWQERPSRAEALQGAARLARIEGAPELALMFARQASEVPTSTDALFVEPEAWGWKRDFELGAAEMAAGDVRRGRQILHRIRTEQLAPQAWLDWIDELLEEGTA